MSTSSRFNLFCENIKLTPAQYADGKTKYDNVCKTLHNFYYPKSEYNGNSKLLIGSYGKETAIRPPSDIDVIFKIPFETYCRFSETKSGPRALLDEIKTILKRTFTTTEKIKPNGMVIEVEFATYKIEVLPAYEWTTQNWNGEFHAPDSSTSPIALLSNILPKIGNVSFSNYGLGSWKRIDPRKEISELNDSNSLCNDNTKYLIKMIKMWLRNCNVDIKSVVIERIVMEFMISYQHNKKSSVYYDYMVRDFLLFLKSKRNTTIFMPGINENIQIGENWYSKSETAYSRAVKACEFEGQQKEFDSANEWKKIFGNDYPY